jgi:hypothetical protein
MAEELVTSYFYRDNKSFGGIYQFPRNTDLEYINLPPNTTLIPPHFEIPTCKESAWDEDKQEWYLRDVDFSWAGLNINSYTGQLNEEPRKIHPRAVDLTLVNRLPGAPLPDESVYENCELIEY